MDLYMIRHGLTDWNAELRFQGQKDIPINAIGQEQATGNGSLLLSILGPRANTYDYVASPLGRTRETMERVRSAMGLDPLAYRCDPRLLEISFGDWEGWTLDELQIRSPDLLKARNASKWYFRPSGENAESFEMLSQRVAPWFAAIDKPTVCVSHGGVMRTILQSLSGMDKNEAAALDIHQDRILHIHTSGFQWLPAITAPLPGH